MKYVKFFTTLVAGLIMFYLTGSFMSVDFNIATWEHPLRAVLALFGIFASFAVALLVADVDVAGV